MTEPTSIVAATKNVTEILRDRMRTLMAESLPQELIDGLAQKAVDEFIAGSQTRDRWGNAETVRPELPGLVRTIVHEELKKKVAERFAERAQAIRDALTDDTVDQAVDLFIGEFGQQALRAFVRAMIGPNMEALSSTLYNIENNLRSRGLY